MAVERTNANGITSQRGREVTTGNHSNRREEYKPVPVLSGRVRKIMEAKIMNPETNWEQYQIIVGRIMDYFKPFDNFSYNHLDELRNRRNRTETEKGLETYEPFTSESIQREIMTSMAA